MFKNGELVYINNGGLGEFNPWTVLDAKEALLGSRSFKGHHGNGKTKGTIWEGHCWFIHKAVWVYADFTLENE